MTKYYHATGWKFGKRKTLKPTNCYESVKKDGCPEVLSAGGVYLGYKTCDVPEVSFSKSIAGAVTAVAEQSIKKKGLVYVYETDENPDIDISDCPGDFSTHEEVRYRRPVRVTYRRKVLVPKDVTEKFAKCIERVGEREELYMTPDSWDYCARKLKRDVKRLL